MFSFPFGETVTVRRTTPPGRDEYDDPIPGTTTEHDIENVAIAPRTSGSKESTDRETQDGLIVGYTLYITDVDADILNTDQVKVYGRWCDVVADPGRYSSPFVAGFGGMVVQLTFAQGV